MTRLAGKLQYAECNCYNNRRSRPAAIPERKEVNLFMSRIKVQSRSLFIYLEIAFLLFLFCIPKIHAQTTSTITGTVTDPQGAIIQGAKVTARSLVTNFTRTVETDAEGRFTFAEMRVGAYEVAWSASASKPGHAMTLS